jgi:nitric oxide reductase large subunit
MVAAAGAMAMSNPLLLNPLILSQVINAQQLNQNDPKFHFSQVNKCQNYLQFHFFPSKTKSIKFHFSWTQVKKIHHFTVNYPKFHFHQIINQLYKIIYNFISIVVNLQVINLLIHKVLFKRLPNLRVANIPPDPMSFNVLDYHFIILNHLG